MKETARRSHRKSRSGCGECKRRRVKCDEARPTCGNCVRIGLYCPYLAASTSPGSLSGSGTVNPATPCTGDIGASPLPTPAAAASMLQLRLLHHLIVDEETIVPLKMKPEMPHVMSSPMLVDMGLECEYLMTAILAFSAMHLAHAQPEQRAMYIEQSNVFHENSLAIFSSCQVDLDTTRLLHVVMFSWLVGTHLLCELVLADPQETDLLSRFLNFLKVFRGVRQMTTVAWRQLASSDDRTLLAAYWTQGVTTANSTGRGGHTLLVQSLIKDSLGMSDQAKSACTAALDLIQSVIDSKTNEDTIGDEQAKCMQMAFAWPLIIDEEFLLVAEQRRPECLLVLAFYAATLHWCRDVWMIGDIGYRLFESISESIGPGWERWLQWPKSVIDEHK